MAGDSRSASPTSKQMTGVVGLVAGGTTDVLASRIGRDGRAWIPARGTSMAPTLRPGDRILVEALGGRGVECGDIVALNRDGRLLVHRVIAAPRARGGQEATEITLSTRGDNEAQVDRHADLADVLGVITARERLGRIESLEGRRGWARSRSGLLRGRLRARLRELVRRRGGKRSRVSGVGGPGAPRDAATWALGREIRLDGAGEGVDWASLGDEECRALGELARAHRVAPWLAFRERENAKAARPGHVAPGGVMCGAAAPIIEAEAERWRHACVRQLSLLDEVLDALAGIRVLVLKGPAHGESLYGSVLARPFSDLDLVVQTADMDEAIAALEASGWRHLPRRRFAWQKEPAEHNFVHPVARGRLEVHRNLVDKPEFVPGLARHPERLWEHAVKSGVAGLECEVLDPEAMLLHALLHAHLHNHAGVLWGLDGALAAEGLGRAVDQARVVDMARAWGMTHIAWAGLALARLDFGADVPAEILDRLRPGPVTRWMVRRIARRAPLLRRERRLTPEQLLMFTLRDGWSRRALALLALPLRVFGWLPERLPDDVAGPAGSVHDGASAASECGGKDAGGGAPR